MVGAVIVRDGRVVGEGWHEGPGRRTRRSSRLAAAGEAARGATVSARSSPATTSAARRRARARSSTPASRSDRRRRRPEPVVDGRGFAPPPRCRRSRWRLGILEAEARRLNAAFERHVVTGLPFVTLKAASSLDGKTAADGRLVAVDHRTRRHAPTSNGSARRPTRSWWGPAPWSPTTRPSPCAIPRIDGRPALRVVVDASGRVPADAQVFDRCGADTGRDHGREPTGDPSTPGRRAAPTSSRSITDEAGGVSVPDLLAHLGKRDVQGVLVEGGAHARVELRSRAVLVDRVVLYLAPKLVGGSDAPGALSGEGFASDRRGRSSCASSTWSASATT